MEEINGRIRRKIILCKNVSKSGSFGFRNWYSYSAVSLLSLSYLLINWAHRVFPSVSKLMGKRMDHWVTVSCLLKWAACSHEIDEPWQSVLILKEASQVSHYTERAPSWDDEAKPRHAPSFLFLTDHIFWSDLKGSLCKVKFLCSGITAVGWELPVAGSFLLQLFLETVPPQELPKLFLPRMTMEDTSTAPCELWIDRKRNCESLEPIKSNPLRCRRKGRFHLNTLSSSSILFLASSLLGVFRNKYNPRTI